jgi:hypothetical protein
MGITLRSWHLGVAVVIGAVIGASVAVAYAARSPFTTVRGGAIAAVAAVRGSTNITAPIGSVSYINVPGAVVRMRGRGLLLVRFTAQSDCNGSLPSDTCSVEIVVDGAAAKPAAPNYVFDANDSSGSQSPAIDRSIKVGPGLHTIRVKAKVSNGGASFGLNDWSLTVERAVT